MKHFRSIILTCTVLLLVLACSSNKIVEPVCEKVPVDRAISYSLDVTPIIRNSCTLPTCHITGFENGDFTVFTQLKEKVVIGILEEVILTNSMPPGYADESVILTDCDKQVLLAWINDEAPNN